ncbi:probable CCR4-associated factor 1 homolog 11 [Phragmites australis]|uniref:probable CCR4-associated factor 1 homolog 11 n=1 Tax=Phragmites australis TaxID=29695 RepID=UPI002D77AA74|nr:probable CCR4-associated factor 1 homolog 11 [Phragmites australis]
MCRHYTQPAAKDNPPSVHQQQPRPHDVFVRPVRAANLAAEVATIRSLLPRYPCVTVHAEYPRCDADHILLPPGVREEDLSPAQRYALAKIDIDTLPVLQLGITLCDADGRLPVLPGPWGAAEAVWQVVFRYSDTRRGVSLGAFAAALFASGAVSPETWGRVTWVAYGGLYHFGFLLKILTGGGVPLPDTKEEFSVMLGAYLGQGVLDGKYVAARLPFCASLEGGLTYVAAMLDTPAVAATELWQAGQKSLVACQVFMRMKGLFFAWHGIDMHAGRIHGLH